MLPRACLVLLLVLGPAVAAQPVQPVLLDLTLLDAETGEPLPGATAQHGDTGAAANAEGRLQLTLLRLPATLIVRSLGYETEDVTITPEEVEDGMVRRTVRLRRAVLDLEQVEVSAENAAFGIMRRVLARKAQLQRRLGAYSAEVYTRFTLERQGSYEAEPYLIRLEEVLSNLHWRASAGSGREEVVARRRVPDGRPFRYAAAEPVADFFLEDAVELGGRLLPTPTHPRTFDLYDFAIGAVTEEDGLRLIDIAVVPKAPGLVAGRLRVVDSLFVLAEADVRIPDRSTPALVQGYDERFRIAYAPAADSLWLPERFEREGYVEVGTTGSRLPRVRFRQVSVVDRRMLGLPGPPELWQSPDRYYSPRGVYGGAEVYAAYRARWPFSDAEAAAEAELAGRAFRDQFYRQGLLANYIPIPVEGDDDPPR